MAERRLINRAKFAELAGVKPPTVTYLCNNRLKAACVGKKIDLDHPAVAEYFDEKFPDVAATGIDPLYENAVRLCTEKNSFTPYAIRKGFSIGAARANKIVATMKAAGIIPEPGEPAPIIVEEKKPRVIKGHTKRNQSKKEEALLQTEASFVHEVPFELEKFADMTLREIIARFGSDYAFVDWLKATKEIEIINEKRLKNAQTRGELVHRDLIKRGVIEPIDSIFIKILSDGAKALSVRIPALHESGQTPGEIEKFISDHIGKFIKPVKSKISKLLKDV